MIGNNSCKGLSNMPGIRNILFGLLFSYLIVWMGKELNPLIRCLELRPPRRVSPHTTCALTVGPQLRNHDSPPEGQVPLWFLSSCLHERDPAVINGSKVLMNSTRTFFLTLTFLILK